VKDKSLYVYAGLYNDTDEADEDYELVKAMAEELMVHRYDVAIIARSEDGSVRVHKHEQPTEHGAWLGLLAGAVVGLVFPATLLGVAIWAGAAAAFGGVVTHLSRGISRAELKDLGEKLDRFPVALVLVTRDEVEGEVDDVLRKASERISKVVDVDHQALQESLEKSFQAMERS